MAPDTISERFVLEVVGAGVFDNSARLVEMVMSQMKCKS